MHFKYFLSKKHYFAYMKKNLLMIIILLVMLYSNNAMAQVTLETPPALTEVLNKHILVNDKMDGKLIGFCVQISFESGTNSRERAEKTRMLFLSKYPKVNAYVTFKEPNFRVRVGCFRTRAEARGFREQILSDFPQSFVVKDEIDYPKHVEN